MTIIIEVSDDKVLEAVVKGMKRAGYGNDVITDPKYIDESDIQQYIIPSLDVDADDITIER